MPGIEEMLEMLCAKESYLSGWEMDFVEGLSSFLRASGENALSCAQKEKVEEIFNRRC